MRKAKVKYVSIDKDVIFMGGTYNKQGDSDDRRN